MENFSELAERLSVPGVVAHMAIILSLVLGALLITWHRSLGSGDFMQTEARTCLR